MIVTALYEHGRELECDAKDLVGRRWETMIATGKAYRELALRISDNKP